MRKLILIFFLLLPASLVYAEPIKSFEEKVIDRCVPSEMGLLNEREHAPLFLFNWTEVTTYRPRNMLLEYAIMKRCKPAVAEVLEMGAPAGGVPSMGPIPISSPIDIAAAEGDLEIAKFLVSKGARAGYGSVFSAINRGHLDMLRWLVLEQDAPVTAEKFCPEFRTTCAPEQRKTMDLIAADEGHNDIADFLRPRVHAQSAHK